MFKIMLIARLLAALLGSQFEQDWACWIDQAGSEHPHVCQYEGVHGQAFVADHDDGLLEITVLWR